MTIEVLSNTHATAEDQPARSHRRGTLVGELNVEWARLRLATSSSDRVMQWAVVLPVLHDVRSLPEAEERHSQFDGPARDAFLLGLIRLGHDGDGLAHRFVLQLMLGKAVRIARSQRSIGDPEEAIAEAVSALWETVRSYPADRRQSRVAANLALDTLSLLHRRRSTRLWETVGLPETEIVAVPVSPSLPVELEVRQLLRWAVDRRAISEDEAHLLLLTHTAGPDGRPPRSADIASSLGITAAAVRKRSQRAITRITEAISETGPLGDA